jgi:hypothetical protein
MPKINLPGFHRRLNRTRLKPISRLPEESLRFIAQSKNIQSSQSEFDEFGRSLSGTIIGPYFPGIDQSGQLSASVFPGQIPPDQSTDHHQSRDDNDPHNDSGTESV